MVGGVVWGKRRECAEVTLTEEEQWANNTQSKKSTLRNRLPMKTGIDRQYIYTCTSIVKISNIKSTFT